MGVGGRLRGGSKACSISSLAQSCFLGLILLFSPPTPPTPILPFLLFCCCCFFVFCLFVFFFFFFLFSISPRSDVEETTVLAVSQQVNIITWPGLLSVCGERERERGGGTRQDYFIVRPREREGERETH